MIDGHKAPCDEGVIQSGADEQTACAERDRPWVLAATILGSSLAFIVGSVVNVALPAIQRGLAATGPEMQWVLNGYLLFLGALILAGGSLGDHYGRRRVFAIGIAVFAGASVGCGFAPSVEWLIAWRAVQGVGGALLVPSSLAIIAASFPKDERGAAIGTWAGFSALTTAFGPVLGGWLVDLGSWRWVFFVVVPFAVVAFVITLWRVPESRDEEAGALDAAGAALVTAGLGALVYGLIASAEAGWGAPRVLAALVAGAALLAAFVWQERHAREPMVPLALFRSPTFSGANLMTLLLYFALNGALYFLPFNLVQVQGYSATAAGAAFLPFTLLMGALSRWAGGLVDRYGAKTPLVAGPLVAAAGLALLMLPGTGGGSYWTTFFPGLLVLGLGMTVSVAPLTTVVMNAVDDHQSGVASGVNNAAARIAGLLAIAIMGVVALAVFSGGLDAQLAALDAPLDAKAAVWDARQNLAGLSVPEDVSPENQQALRGVVNAAFVRSFRWVMGLGAALALVSAGAAAWLIQPREAEEERQAAGA